MPKKVASIVTLCSSIHSWKALSSPEQPHFHFWTSVWYTQNHTIVILEWMLDFSHTNYLHTYLSNPFIKLNIFSNHESTHLHWSTESSLWFCHHDNLTKVISSCDWQSAHSPPLLPSLCTLYFCWIHKESKQSWADAPQWKEWKTSWQRLDLLFCFFKTKVAFFNLTLATTLY